ncbi:YtxH domain-containing protein [Neobacillus massiliamazoniensis]|jgi:gas vesicle protein|uniref:UDP-glucose/GDP-mannose dehydrogenase family protein n=1 Tax=Neobacillus massiliamazoniensis TaxID=1499688 RepID=A0A0U1NV56_9BACI|nr:YtxH domain-containing protein [Neobacillus massiliamazoniensis]CRK81906.1 UDP-glucose/GDP-mannose dehydrogenase family protein [Neobacillus massiliamazoniensis]
MKNHFWRGMLLGAIAGGALSLLDKGTRQAMKTNVCKASSKISYIVKNPGDVTKKVKETAENFKATFEQISEDISFMTEKVDELRDLTPQVTDILKETKDTFTKNEESSLFDEEKVSH